VCVKLHEAGDVETDPDDRRAAVAEMGCFKMTWRGETRPTRFADVAEVVKEEDVGIVTA